VTPPGIERSGNSTKLHEDQLVSPANAHPGAVSRRLVKADSSKVAKLALLAENAVRNYDLQRAVELLRDIRALCVLSDEQAECSGPD
jgi:hypothetical protein